MKNFGFIRVAAAIPRVCVADVRHNVTEIERQMREAADCGVEIVVFPEACLTGYSCQDLFAQQLLIDKAEAGVARLIDASRTYGLIAIVGTPLVAGNLLLNCAVVVERGTILGIVAKEYLPNYGEFYEKRWFASAQELRPTRCGYAGQEVEVSAERQVFSTADGVRFGVEICEDVWAPIPPSNRLALAGADIVFNLSASDEVVGKHRYLRSLLAQQSARTISGYVYSSSGYGESTQDVVYGGNGFVFENGVLLAQSKRFSFEPQLVVSEIDVERLRAERQRNTTFINAQRRKAYWQDSVQVKMVPPLNGNVILDEGLRMKDESSNQRSLSRSGESNPSSLIRINVNDNGNVNTNTNTNTNTNNPSSLISHPSSENGPLFRQINPTPFIPLTENNNEACQEILNIQVAALAKRLQHTRLQRVVIGISGGLDSTLALLVCVMTFDKLGYSRNGILGVTMPGMGTSGRTHDNAVGLMNGLGISMREISIAKAVAQHFDDIGHNPDVHDTTYENAQARERTQILMDVANQLGALVIGTGDLSELALGWCTYNGDQMSMYALNSGIPKTLVRHLVNYIARTDGFAQVKEILTDITETPISPELTPAKSDGTIAQMTEDLVGPYELHDFFLYYMLRFGFSPKKIYFLARNAFPASQYSDATIKKWLVVFLRRFFSQQFKRSCMPDGPKVGSVSLSPRGDWRMPSDASANLWIDDAQEL